MHYTGDKWVSLFLQLHGRIAIASMSEVAKRERKGTWWSAKNLMRMCDDEMGKSTTTLVRCKLKYEYKIAAVNI